MFVLIDWLVCLCSFTQHCVCAGWLIIMYSEVSMCWPSCHLERQNEDGWTGRRNQRQWTKGRRKRWWKKVSPSSPQTITWNDKLGENNNKDHLLTWVSLTGICQVFNKGFSSELFNGGGKLDKVSTFKDQNKSGVIWTTGYLTSWWYPGDLNYWT